MAYHYVQKEPLVRSERAPASEDDEVDRDNVRDHSEGAVDEHLSAKCGHVGIRESEIRRHQA